MTTATWKQKLKALDPCPEAYKWACQYNTLRQAWRACEERAWMTWLWDACQVGTSEPYRCLYRALDIKGLTTDVSYAERSLQDAYIILDFMPDPPELP